MFILWTTQSGSILNCIALHAARSARTCACVGNVHVAARKSGGGRGGLSRPQQLGRIHSLPVQSCRMTFATQLQICVSKNARRTSRRRDRIGPTPLLLPPFPLSICDRQNRRKNLFTNTFIQYNSNNQALTQLRHVHPRLFSPPPCFVRNPAQSPAACSQS